MVERIEALLRRHPELIPLEAAILVALAAAESEQGRALDTGRLAREFELEHALVRRAASALETRGWVTSETRSGRSPGLRLRLARPVEV